MQVLLSCEDQFLRTTSAQRPTYNVSRYDRLVTSLEREVVTLFERELNYHVRVEKARREMALRYDWTARGAFETVDALREYVLNHRNIQSFLRLNGFYATDGEVISMIRRIDADGDDRVTFEEFNEAVRPSVPVSPAPLISSSSAVYEEAKRSSSPLRRTAASPLRQTTEHAASQHHLTLQASATRLNSSANRLTASQLSPSRSQTLYAPAVTASPSRRYSPLKADDENELVRAFKEQIALENELEDAKNRLALQPDFNLPDAFDLLDRHLLGSFTATELLDSLASNGVYVVSEDVALYVKRYDRNLDGRLNYLEFQEATTPKNASYSTQLQLRRAHYSVLRVPRHEYFTAYTRDLLFKTLRVHFSVEASAENLRRRLIRRPGFNASDAFTAVDQDRDGFITRDEFRGILRDWGFYATETEISWLVDRYDRNRDGRISYSEFVEEIMPKSPSRV